MPLPTSTPYRPFREFHTLRFLNNFEQQQLPLDFFLSQYFRSHKALGSKDRGFVARTVYAMVRWLSLLDYLCKNSPKNSPTWEEKLTIFLSPAFEKAKIQEEIPMPVRLSFPHVLMDLLIASHGIEKAVEICKVSNTEAPTTVRINLLKSNRDEMIKRWSKTYDISPCKIAGQGIVFNRRMNFFDLPEFKAGMFEVQDEGSQLIAELVQAKPGDLVMDYCAGSGGKALGFAPKMQNTGQIYLHDVRKAALQDARKRLRRAGVQNAQVVAFDEAKIKKLKKKMDWVLVDAPCSGTGTLRRNPDMKWKFDEAMLTRLRGQQRTIFEKALSFLKPGGRIVYATCSVLNEENSCQAEHFLKTYGLTLDGEIFESFPTYQGMDGFYGVVFRT